MASGYGAAYDFDILRFGGPTVPDEFSVTVGTTATPILKNDPDRLAIYMTNNSAGPVYWSTRSLLTVAESFAIGSGIVTVFQVQNDGALCTRALWAIAPAGPYVINIIILRRQSKGG